MKEVLLRTAVEIALEKIRSADAEKGIRSSLAILADHGGDIAFAPTWDSVIKARTELRKHLSLLNPDLTQEDIDKMAHQEELYSHLRLYNPPAALNMHEKSLT